MKWKKKDAFCYSNLFGNAGWLLCDRLTRIFLGLLFNIWFAKALGPDQFGFLQYAVSIVTIFSCVGTLSIDSVLLHELAVKKNDDAVLLASASLLRLSGSILAILLSTFVAYVISSRNWQFTIVAFITSSSFLLQTSDILYVFFQSRGAYRVSSVSRIVSYIIASILKLFVLLNYQSLVVIASLPLLDLLLSSIALYVIYRHTKTRFSLDNALGSVCKSLLTRCIPLSVSAGFVVIFMRIDQIMLAMLDSTHATGIYSAALRLVEPWGLFPATLLRAFYPQYVKHAVGDRASFDSHISRVFFVSHIMAVFLAGLLTFFSAHIITLIYGKDFSESVAAFSILSWSLVFTFSGEVRAQLFMIDNLVLYHTYCAILGLVVLVPLNLILIPMYGIVGAAISLVISYALSAMGSTIIFPKLRPIFCQQLWPFCSKPK